LNSSHFLQSLLRKQQGDQLVGKILDVRRDARHRMNQSLTWFPAEASEQVYERDSLFTGADSELDIEINDKQIIHLFPNSLLVIQTNNNKVVLDLQIGTIKLTRPVRSSTSEAPLQILNLGKAEVLPEVTEEDSVVIQKTEGGPIAIEETSQPGIPATSFAPAVTAPTATPIPTVSRSLTVATPSPTATPLQIVDPPVLKNPAAETKLVYFENAENAPLIFNWKNSQQTDFHELEIAQDPQFNRVLVSQKTSSSAFVLNAPPVVAQKIYWRVRSHSGKSISDWSEVRRIEIEIAH
jgi:hypothetical protein